MKTILKNTTPVNRALIFTDRGKLSMWSIKQEAKLSLG